MPYLNCPSCRLTVYRPVEDAEAHECPRCSSRLGKVSRLFRSEMPRRLSQARSRQVKAL